MDEWFAECPACGKPVRVNVATEPARMSIEHEAPLCRFAHKMMERVVSLVERYRVPER